MTRNLLFAFIGIVLMVEAVPPKVKIGALLAFNSTIGNAALAAMQLAIEHINQNDTILNGTLLELKAYDTHCNAFHGAAAAIALMGEEVAAIAGPQTSEASQFVAHMAGYTQVPLVSFSATDPTLSASLYKYFLRVAPSDNFHMEAIARLVSRFEWREVVALHTDDQFGTNGIDMLNNALQQVGATIAHRSAFDPRINRTEINEALADYVDMGARIFVMHMNPNIGRVVLVEAYNLMMLATGYAWIMTEAISSVLESIYHDHSFLQATQGIIGTHSYVQHSQQWKKFMQEMKNLTNIHANIYSLYAYDTIWTIAQAIHKFLNMNGTFTFLPPNLFHANSDLGKLKIFEQGPILQKHILASEFTGVSGKIRFDAYGDVPDCTLIILNMLGKKPRAVGSWTMRHGLSFELPQLPTSAIESPPSLLSQRGPPVEKAASIIWPGGTSRVPRGWLIPRGGRPLLIGVPNKQGYTEFVQIKFDKANNHATFHGFCIEVFKAALAYLPYTVPYSFVSYGDGHATPSYDELVRKVERKEFDAAVGDITITTERTQIVDFTQPYTTSGLVVVVPVKRIGGSTEAWSFLKPFTVGMWCTTVAFFLFTGLVIFLLEHKKNPDFRGGAKKEIVTTLWFIFSTLFFSQREDVKSTLGRAVLIIWLVVVLILISSYTAGYTSILTVQQLVPTIDGISGLLESNVPIGFQAGSFVESYLLNLNVPKSRLVPLNSMASYARALYDGPSKGGVGAIVDELRYVQLFLSSECEFKISGQDFTRAGWGFAFPKGSTLAVDISEAILTLDENGALQRLEQEWLQGAECDSQFLEVGGNQLGLHNYWALFAIYGGVAMFACMLYSLRLLWQYYRLKHPSILRQNSCLPRTAGRYITCSEARSL